MNTWVGIGRLVRDPNVKYTQSGKAYASFTLAIDRRRGGIGYTKECVPTLIADHPMYVAIYDMTHADEVMRPVKDGIVPTLNARMGTGGNQVPVVHAYCIAGNTIDRKIENGGNGKGHTCRNRLYAQYD